MRTWNGSAKLTSLPLKHQKLYALRLLKSADVQERDMLKVFRTSSVRPILEYAVKVWQDIPDYLSDRIESVKPEKRHLKSFIIHSKSFPVSDWLKPHA